MPEEWISAGLKTSLPFNAFQAQISPFPAGNFFLIRHVIYMSNNQLITHKVNQVKSYELNQVES